MYACIYSYALLVPYLPSTAPPPPQKLLSPTGSCYMVLVQENRPAEIAKLLREGYGLHSEVSIS
jgi:hypothetical protein